MSADAPAVKVPESEPLVPDPQPGDEIRRFAHSGIQSAIDAALAQLPPDKTVAFVGHHEVGTSRSQLAVMVRLDGGWSFSGVLQHAPSRGFSGEAAVMWSR